MNSWMQKDSHEDKPNAELWKLTSEDERLILKIYDPDRKASKPMQISDKGMLVDKSNNMVDYIKNCS